MTDTITLRASSAPLARKCSESVRSGEGIILIDAGEKSAAHLGTAVHKAVELEARGEAVDLDDMADRFQVERDELGFMFAMARKAVTALDELTPGYERLTEAQVEVDLGGDPQIILRGRIDYARIDREAKRAAILDHKSGRVERSHDDQQRSYGFGLHCTYGPFESITLLTDWLRDGRIDHVTLTAAEIEAWAEEFFTGFRNGWGRFAPGPHCINDYCPRRDSCPGRRAWEGERVKDLAVYGEGIPEVWTEDNHKALGPVIVPIYEALTAMEKRIEAAKNLVREKCQQWGSMPDGGGRALKIIEVNRREAEPAKALPILAQHLTPEELHSTMKLSISQAEQIVASKAPPREKGKAKEALAAELEAAGAIAVNTQHQLRLGKDA